jgi:hypothetical protein
MNPTTPLHTVLTGDFDFTIPLWNPSIPTLKSTLASITGATSSYIPQQTSEALTGTMGLIVPLDGPPTPSLSPGTATEAIETTATVTLTQAARTSYNTDTTQLDTPFSTPGPLLSTLMTAHLLPTTTTRSWKSPPGVSSSDSSSLSDGERVGIAVGAVFVALVGIVGVVGWDIRRRRRKVRKMRKGGSGV